MPVAGTCKLCRREAYLQRSHYLGKAFYRICRNGGELPVLASPSLIVRSQKQVADYVLCRPCEQRFSNHGETYATQMVRRGDSFRLMDLIRANPRRRIEGEYVACRADDMGIRTDFLAYFALSVIWRGAVHTWRTFKRRATPRLDLGIHEERIRRHLLGEEPFPQGVCVKVSAASDEESQMAARFPRENPDQADAAAFEFMTFGIWFDVVLGDPLPDYIPRDNCCVSSPDKPIFFGDFKRFVLYDISEYRKTARIAIGGQR